MLISQEFFQRDSETVAAELLGQSLLRQTDEGGLIELPVTEVEIYDGLEDLASHARFGKTRRNAPMFGSGGHWYMYLIYGMYWMINITTQKEGYPAALLIRGAGKFDGPGKLSKALQVDGNLSGKPAHPASGLWVEKQIFTIQPFQKTPRIGISYAGDWKDKKWRYIIE